MKKIVGVLILLLLVQSALAQGDIPVGTWRTHFPYRKTDLVTLSQGVVYTSSFSSLFLLQNNEIQVLSALNGLSDTGISALSAINDAVYIGYQNGNLDILQDYAVRNLDFILNSGIQNDKSINGFIEAGQEVFILTGFGVVVLNPATGNVVDIYQELGEEGTELVIHDGVILRDTLFLATDQGIIAGSLDPAVNLKDFRNWRRFGTEGDLPENPAYYISINGNLVYTVFNGDSIYNYDGNEWSGLSELTGATYDYLGTSAGRNFLIANGTVYEEVGDTFIPYSDALIQKPQMVASNGNDLFIATQENGLVTDQNGAFEALYPNGPFSSAAFRLRSIDNRVFVCPGGFDASRLPNQNQDGFSRFANGTWENFNAVDPENSSPMPTFEDITDVATTGSDYYLSSFGYGILRWEGGADFSIIDENTPGSLLENINPPDRHVYVTSIESEADNLWITNYGANEPYKVIRADGTWESYAFPQPGALYPLKITVSPNGDKWVILDPEQGGGILVFNEEDNLSRRLTTTAGNGNLPDNEVNEIVLDREGLAWVATTRGVVFFPFTRSVLRDDEVDGVIPIFESSLLFDNENVTALEVDGGNRKWMATSGGAWLFDADLRRIDSRFTEENSPLISNSITDIEIDGRSGEVFFITDQGIISYRGTATTARQTHEQAIRIFPNPVKANFSGLVSFSGLAENAIVKVTDLSGVLVWQQRANGGTATWNVRDLNGQKPATGIYLVLSSTEDGADTLAGKLAIIN